MSADGPRAERPIRTVSVHVPVFQGGAHVDELLDALAAQDCPLPWDLWITDSGSEDGTWERVCQRARGFPVRLVADRIHPLEFDHGDTRNRLAARSAGDLLVFLTQDALPCGPDWLARLARNFDDDRVGAAWCRNEPRPDADLLTRVFSRTDPAYRKERRVVELPDEATYAALDPHQRRELWALSDVASAFRRELWELHPFPRTSFGEDILMARALIEAGWRVVFDEEASVWHSHDHDPQEARQRARVDGRFSAEWLGRVCIASREDAAVQVERQLEVDRAELRAAGVRGPALEAELERARALRRATFEGLWEGGRSPLRRPPTRMLARRRLEILQVVHGFPPETWAGTEVYALNLAKALSDRGHRLTVLARSPGTGSAAGRADFEVFEDRFEGLRVLRLVNRLDPPTLLRSFDEPRAEAAFRAVLERLTPDLVHFQHLIHLSAGLVEVARRQRLATVLHLHDYWALCARVQMIRPDGQRCEETMGHGCLACIKDRDPSRIPWLRRVGPWLAPFMRAANAFVHGDRVERSRRTGLHRALADWHDVERRARVVPEAYARADLCASPSRFLREKLLHTGRFDPQRVLFSQNGLRTEGLVPRPKRPDPEGRLRLGFVGSLVWYKGAEVLVRAVRRLAARSVVALVFGDFRPDEDRHHAELARLASGAPVEFRGRFPNDALAEVHAQIDVLCVPSLWYENAPVSIQEAFLTGTPVLVSDLGGMAEMVADGAGGLRFAPGDDADMAQKIERLRDPALRERLARAAPAVKTIRDDAADWEYRYRALLAQRPG